MTTQAEEFSKLADLEPETPPAEPEATAEEKAAAEAQEAEAKVKAEADAEEEKAKKWSVPLQKLQQQRAADAREIQHLHGTLAKQTALLEKMAKLNGIEEEAPAAAAPVPNDESELKTEIATTKRELEFIKIRQANPDADPDKMWDESIAEILELHGINADDEQLPEGLTQRALSIAANKVFQKKVASLKPAKKPEPAPPKTPPKTPGGASATSKPASHVPATPAQKAYFDRQEEYKKLAGLLP